MRPRVVADYGSRDDGASAVYCVRAADAVSAGAESPR